MATNAATPARVVMLLDNHHGPDRRIEMEASLLAGAGADVRVVAWDRRTDPPADAPADEAGPQLVRIRVPAPSGGGKRTFVAMARFGREVWRRRRELAGDADVVVAHDVYLLPLGWLLSLALRRPLVYDAHEDYAAMEGRRYPRWWLRLITGMENLLARRAAAIVVPGTTRRPRWERAGFPPPVVLRNLGVGRPRPDGGPEPAWDVAYSGTLADVRRLDVLLEAARRKPELRVVVAGRGRGAGVFEEAARTLDNVEYLGWRTDTDALTQRARCLYYGLDPSHPYARMACPNTLYDALRLRRPLVYYCEGEVAELAARHRIGVRCDPTPESLLAAIDEAGRADAEWDFDAAWAELTRPEATREYVDAILAASRGDTRFALSSSRRGR